LLMQPRLMLLDEPTASLDGALEATVMKHLFGGIPAESTIVAVTHKPALLPFVSRLIVLDRGKVALDGPRDQVLARLQKANAAEAAV